MAIQVNATKVQQQQQQKQNDQFDGQKVTKALAIWVAGKLNVPLATAKSEIIAILKTL